MNDRNSAVGSARSPVKPEGSLWRWGVGAAVAGTALASAALISRTRAERANRENPPLGRRIMVNGVSLHYLERGTGPTIVLLHGNGTMIQDWIASGVLDQLAATNRVIAFDRPGFGYSTRPRTRIWTAAAQAALIGAALKKLNVTKPLVVGHSFGTLVALELALQEPAAASGLVLLGGYYYPSMRADVAFAAPPALPVIGDLMRYTVSPFLASAMKPRIDKKLFAPAQVPDAWSKDFPFEVALRPSQIRAEAAEAALMIPGAASLEARLETLAVPASIVAGEGDEVVTTTEQSQRLHEALPDSTFQAISGAGHMVHHTATDEVVAAIRGAASRPTQQA